VRPAVVEISLTQLSGGTQNDAGGAVTKKGRDAVPVAGKPYPAAASPKIKTISAGTEVPLKAVEQVPLAKPTPVPTVPANAQAQQSRNTSPPAGREAAGSANNQGSTGSEQAKPGQGGGSVQADGASGGRSGASGSVSGTGNGRGTSPEQLQKKYLSEHFAYIMKIIQDHIVYPKKARREGLTGKALVSFVVLEDGQVANIRLLRSTGYEILDVNLIKTIKDVAPFPKPPKRAELQMPFSYHLEQ